MKPWIFGIVAVCLSNGVLGAQTQGTVSGPVTGYVFDPAAHGLRPVLGLPGASLLGDPISFGLNATAAFISPRLDSAVAVAADGAIHFFQIQSGALTETPVNGLTVGGASAMVAFSPSGTAAAVYDSSLVEVVAGLPNTPAIHGKFRVGTVTRSGPAHGSALQPARAQRPDALAISDDGAAVLVSMDHAIRLFGSNADLGKLMDTSNSAALAFAAGGHDAAIADSTAGVVLYRDLTGAGNSQMVSPPDDESASPSALAFSADGKTIYLASSAAQSVTQLDLTAGSRTRIPCSCSPTALTRMGKVFRLTDLSGDPLWLLDAPEASPRVVFVPALAQ